MVYFFGHAARKTNGTLMTLMGLIYTDTIKTVSRIQVPATGGRLPATKKFTFLFF